MNHSGAFWKVKNTYSDELRELWAQGYTGEGMWSRGRTLLSGEYVTGGATPDDGLLEHLCGGTFRTSGKRKRFAKPKLSWKEQKERRIKKKFGVDGKTLGADDEVKSELEGGKKQKGKPRVAGSKRGRELRAAAALARFETPKKEEPEVKDENDISTDSGSDTEGDAGLYEAHDIDGSTLHDRKGRTMVKVCDDEEKDDVNVKNEMDELLQLQNLPDKQGGEETESDDDELKKKAAQKRNRKRKSKSSSRESPMVVFGPDAEPSVTPGDQGQQYGSKTEDTASDPELSDESDYTKSKPNPKRRLVPGNDSRPQVFDDSESESDYFEKNLKLHRELFLTPKERREKKIANEFFGNLATNAKDGGKCKENEKDKPLKAAGRNTKSGTLAPEVAFNPPFDTPAASDTAVAKLGSNPAPIPDDFPTIINCPVCTSENEINASVCSVCANVLDPDQLEGTWKCRRGACQGSEYVNAADYGVCGVCGEPK